MTFIHGLAVFLLGGLGAVCRFSLTLLFSGPASGVASSLAPWPLSTLVANGVGCFLAGCVTAGIHAVAQTHGNEAALLWTRIAMTGFLGGFTPFSAFSVEVLQFARGGQFMNAALYAGGSATALPLLTAAGFFLVATLMGGKSGLGF